MSARRPPWVWWGAGALFLLAIAGWVFWASQRSDRFQPLTDFGSPSLPVGTTPGTLPPAGAPRNNTRGGLDPRLQETLQTVNEINRLNRMNAEMRKPETPPTPPASPLPPVPESGTTGTETTQQ